MDKIKYVHIMPHKSLLYNAQIVEMINKKDDYFKGEEHLFVIEDEKVYNQVEKYKNTVLEKNISKDDKLIKKYSEQCNYIFLHSNALTTKVLIFLNKNILKKIIWCVWGHDLYDIELKKVSGVYRKLRRFAGNIYRTINNYIRNQRIKKFYAVGIGMKYDAIEIKRKFGKNMNIVMTPYGYVENDKWKIDKIIEEYKSNIKSTKIMIGHSAFEFLNHKKVLKQLYKYKDKDIIISLVLAYGDNNYKEEVKNYAIELFGDKVEIIENMMTQDEYYKYLMSVDICILDYKHQAALANVYMLLYMGKKLYLNKEGLIKLVFTLENIDTYNVNEIDEMDFDTFKAPIKNNNSGKKFSEFYIDKDNYLDVWKKTLMNLN